MEDMDLVEIDKSVEIGTCPFSRIFKGFEKVEAVQSIFGDRTKKALAELEVEACRPRKGGYMWIDDEKERLDVDLGYIQSAEKRYLYLDVIHELVHVRQMREGKELFDEKYKYIERPTELEAYDLAVEEAKKIGMSNDEIKEYLKVEWIPKKDFETFLKRFELDS